MDPAVPLTFKSCSDKVGYDFNIALDIEHSSTHHVEALLERGIKVLFYVGEYDWICNWVGNLQMAKNLEWSGQAGFLAAEERQWEVDGKKAGRFRSEEGSPLAFATIAAAGHMVSLDTLRL